MERILIVDDQAVIRKTLSAKLAGEGFECVAVGDGDSALREMEKGQFSLVLLDINMPGKTGKDIIQEIVPRYPNTAVIMITSEDDAETVIEVMRLGAYDYIIKPVNFHALIISVRRALERRKLLLENMDYQLHLEEKVEQQSQKIRNSFLNSMKSLALALEAKDEYTSGHSQRVAATSIEIALEMGMTPEQIDKIRFAAMVHDIGKIGIGESVLLKTEGLTDEEFSYIASHPVIAEHILRPVVDDEEILRMVRHHHERYDGEGYPFGLAGEQIPYGARILAVADMYDAMTSDRPYRKAVGHDIAITELEKQSGIQFDPQVVDTFIRISGRAGGRSRQRLALSWLE